VEGVHLSYLPGSTIASILLALVLAIWFGLFLISPSPIILTQATYRGYLDTETLQISPNIFKLTSFGNKLRDFEFYLQFLNSFLVNRLKSLL
jgi:hypothetical protein